MAEVSSETRELRLLWNCLIRTTRTIFAVKGQSEAAPDPNPSISHSPMEYRRGRQEGQFSREARPEGSCGSFSGVRATELDI